MSDIDRQAGDYEKLAFQEESACLDVVKSRIDALIEKRDSRITPLKEALPNLRTYDYDDIDRKKIAIGDLERHEVKKAELETYKPDPYFCHFELIVDGEESREFCICDRKHDLRDGEGAIVLGRWSPLRTVYINKGQKRFELEVSGEKHTFDLRLRRMVRIKDASLVGVTTEFDSADASLDGEIVDPFLVDILKDKRRDYKLTDIVKTIQQNQNDILERPIDESFVVQGCAGSGKTMILLHRLSYLAFTHPEVDFSKYLVLTPNEVFNKHIDELCSELDIGTITRLTVESYYVRLARKLSENDVQPVADGKGRVKQVPKINISAENVVPEYGLPTEYLSEVYSDSFAERVEGLFDSAKEDVLREIESSPTGSILLERGAPTPGSGCAPYAAYLGILRACSKVKKDNAAALADVQDARKAYEDTAERLEEVSAAYNSALESLEPARVAVVESALPLYESKKLELEELRREAANARGREKRAKEAVESATSEFVEADKALAIAKANLDSARELANVGIDVKEAESEYSVIEKASDDCSDERAEVARLQKELDEVGLFGFGRRRVINEEIERARTELHLKYQERLKAAAEEHVERVRIERADAVKEAERAHSSAEQSVSEAREVRDESFERYDKAKSDCDAIAASLKRVGAEVDVLKRPVAAFKNDRYPNLAAIEDVAALEAVSPELANYVGACRGLTQDQARYLYRGDNRVKILEEQLEEAREAMEEAEAFAFSDFDEGALAEAERLGAKLDASVFDAMLSRELSALKSRFGVTTPTGKSHRHDLYLKALECVLYYGPAWEDDASICVDEAQDLSLAEHALIRKAVGPRAALNLYGDTNQLVFPYKGVRSWSDLPDGVAANRYELHENYRNTLQITAYCNERLGMDVTAIGLRGSEVSRLGLSAAVEELFALKGANPGIRCAIIYKRGLSGVKESLKSLLGPDASYGYVDVSRISVIPVETAKGLEFDAVVVIDNDMSKNEKYLSYTRALDHLMVTHVKGAVVGETEEISSETGRTVGSTKLKEAELKPSGSKPNQPTAPEEPEADPFFDLDFS